MNRKPTDVERPPADRTLQHLDRSRARSWALQVLYRWESDRSRSLSEALDDTLQTRRVSPRRTAYLERLVRSLEANAEAVDSVLRGALSNWTLERLSTIDRSILRIGATEILHFRDVPPKVSIREAMLLAESYSGPDSPAFVNGVLDAIHKRGA